MLGQTGSVCLPLQRALNVGIQTEAHSIYKAPAFKAQSIRLPACCLVGLLFTMAPYLFISKK